MEQGKTNKPAGKAAGTKPVSKIRSRFRRPPPEADRAPDNKPKVPWHRRPALVAAIVPAAAVVALTLYLGQDGGPPIAVDPPSSTTTPTQVPTSGPTSTQSTTEGSETPVESPTAVESSGPQATAPPGSLAVTVQLGPSGKVGPGEYRVGSDPGGRAQAFDEDGLDLGAGCRLTWVLKRERAVVAYRQAATCDEVFSFGSSALDHPGLYQLLVSAVSDTGEKGTTTIDFRVS